MDDVYVRYVVLVWLVTELDSLKCVCDASNLLGCLLSLYLRNREWMYFIFITCTNQAL